MPRFHGFSLSIPLQLSLSRTLPLAQLDLHRNNAHALKILRMIAVKVCEFAQVCDRFKNHFKLAFLSHRGANSATLCETQIQSLKLAFSSHRGAIFPTLCELTHFYGTYYASAGNAYVRTSSGPLVSRPSIINFQAPSSGFASHIWSLFTAVFCVHWAPTYTPFNINTFCEN